MIDASIVFNGLMKRMSSARLYGCDVLAVTKQYDGGITDDSSGYNHMDVPLQVLLTNFLVC